MPASSLRRSTTLRGSSAANRAAVARRAASKKKTATVKRTTSLRNKRGTVNATEAYRIAAAAALDLKEDKYFNVAPDGLYNLQASTVGNKIAAVLSFGTISNQKIDPAQPTGTSTWTYGGNNMVSMNMLLPFTLNAPASYGSYQPDGKSVKPNGGSTKCTFQRSIVKPPGVDDWQLPFEMNPDTYRTLPMRIRIVRVTPRQARGVVTDINPDEDLFQNQYGKEQGIASADFSSIDMEFSKVNPEKYITLQDTQFSLAPTNVASGYFTNDGNNHTKEVQESGLPSRSSIKSLEMKHQLTDKRGQDVRYDVVGSMASPEYHNVSGMRREFVFIHAWYQGTGNGVLPSPETLGNPTEAQPNIQLPNGLQANPADITAMFRFRSTFKDV